MGRLIAFNGGIGIMNSNLKEDIMVWKCLRCCYFLLDSTLYLWPRKLAGLSLLRTLFILQGLKKRGIWYGGTIRRREHLYLDNL